MANSIRVGVENPAELLNAGMYGAGALIQIQSSATEAGVYADLTGTGSTPTIAIVAGTTADIGYDPNGVATTWYRTRYRNSGGTITSDWTDPFLVGAGALASIYDLKQRLFPSRSETDLSDDGELAQTLGYASDYIHGYTERYFLPDDGATYTFDGSAALSGRCLIVRRGIRAITTLKIASQTGGTLSLVAASGYFLRPHSHELPPGWPYSQLWLSDVGSSIFSPGYDNIEIVGNFGFASVPGDIAELCLTLSTRLWGSRQAGQADAVGTGESGPATVSRYLSKRDMETLDRYRGSWVA